jgi:hypothetical protein
MDKRRTLAILASVSQDELIARLSDMLARGAISPTQARKVFTDAAAFRRLLGTGLFAAASYKAVARA